jgi:hypothetical protein
LNLRRLSLICQPHDEKHNPTRESALTMPSVQHDHDVFSSAASQIAILGAALLAVLIMAWLYL